MGRPNGGYLNNREFQMLHVNVKGRTANGITKLPTELAHNQYWTEKEVNHKRTLHITGQPGTNFSFDNVGYSMNHDHAGAMTTQIVKLGDVEEWTVVNNQVFGHSFHIHDIQFIIVSRSSGPVASIAIAPDPGLKIAASFEAPASVYTTLVAPGGRIEITYPGYSRDSLVDLSRRIASICGIKPQLSGFGTAPGTLTAGCPFPKRGVGK